MDGAAFDGAALAAAALTADALGCAAGSSTTLDCVAAVGAALGSAVDAPEEGTTGEVFVGAVLTGAAFVLGTAFEDSSFAAPGFEGTPAIGAALAVTVFAAAALTAGCLVDALLPAPVDDIAAGHVEAADLLVTVDALS